MKWNLIGHEKTIEWLEEKLSHRPFPAHAFLFVGPEHIGKFTMAKTLAKILQCPNNFCHTCPTCVQISKGYHLDTIEMDDNGESIKIDQVRDILARFSMTSQSAHKILLMANIGRLADEGANTLLKILEEPPERTFFFFTVTNLRDVLPTILSRIQIIKLKSVEENILRQSLREKYPKLPQNVLDQVMMLSLGKPGKALSLIENPEQCTFYQELFEQVRVFSEEKNITGKFQIISDIIEDPHTVREFLVLLAHYLRQRLLPAPSGAEAKSLLLSLKRIHRILDLLKRNVNPRLLLENFAL